MVLISSQDSPRWQSPPRKRPAGRSNSSQLADVDRCGISSIFKLQIWSVVSGWLCLFMFVRVLEGTTFNEPEASRGASSDSSSQQRAELKEPAKPKSKA